MKSKQLLRAELFDRFISLGATKELANHISELLTKRRGRQVDYITIGTILICMVVRRMENNNSTQYAIEFDRQVVGSNAQVLSIMNKSLASIQINGQGKINGTPFISKVLPSDMNLALGWLLDGTFSKALSDLKSYAQANELALVQLDCFTPYIQPSIFVQIEKDSNYLNKHRFSSIPTVFRKTKEVEVINKELQADGTFKDVITTEIVLENDSPNLEQLFAPDAQGDSHAIIFSQSVDSIVRTPAQALSLLFPTLEFVSSVGDISETALHYSGKSVFTYEDTADFKHHIFAAYSLLINTILADRQKETSPIVGSLDTRIQVRQPAPAEGSQGPGAYENELSQVSARNKQNEEIYQNVNMPPSYSNPNLLQSGGRQQIPSQLQPNPRPNRPGINNTRQNRYQGQNRGRGNQRGNAISDIQLFSYFRMYLKQVYNINI